MTLYGDHNIVLATSSDSATASLPKPLSEEVVLQMQQARPFVSLESMSTGASKFVQPSCLRIAVAARNRRGSCRRTTR